VRAQIARQDLRNFMAVVAKYTDAVVRSSASPRLFRRRRRKVAGMFRSGELAAADSMQNVNSGGEIQQQRHISIVNGDILRL
jgi:hypothetical protein